MQFFFNNACQWSHCFSQQSVNHRLSYISLIVIYYAHRTLHDATRHDNSRQENRVMCGGLRHEVTRQDKTGLVVSDLTMLDTCDKARFLYCRVVDPRTLHDFLD